MSLEAKIEALTAAVVALTARMGAEPQIVAQVQTPAPVVAAPVVAAPVAAAPQVQMPAPPTFAAAPAPVAAGAPFTDTKGLIAYVMDAYKAMGPQKGANIQGILVNLGYQNINDVKPEHFGSLFAGVEQLKAA